MFNKGSFNKANKWEGQDWLELFPIDEFTDLKCLKVLGWTKADIKKLVRMKIIQGELDSRGGCNINLLNIKKAIFISYLADVISLKIKDWNNLEEVQLDFESILADYIVEKKLGPDGNLADLKKQTR